MRVIAGKYRGRVLKQPEGDDTRPTMDRIKQSLFDVLMQNITDAKVLDLFCGSGSLGIEALSRGAKDCIFVDNNKKAVGVVNQNLQALKIEAEVIMLDYLEALRILKNRKIQFNLIFIDAPYASDFGINAIDYLLKNNLLYKKGLIVFETSLSEVDFEYDRVLNYKNKFIYLISK